MIKNRILDLLDRPSFRTLLLVLHVLIVCVVVIKDNVRSPDEATYMGLARSMEKGGYSVWQDILDPPPTDVVRTHGYPTFLFLIAKLGGDRRAVFAVQALLYLGMLTILLSLLAAGKGNVVGRQNIFLLIMLPQFQIVYYVGQIFPEILMAFAGVMAVFLAWRRDRLSHQVILGAVLAIGFWVRPVFLLFPLFMLLADLVLVKGMERWKTMKWNVLALFFFLLLGPLPFTLWNLNAHGVARPVPLTGSALISNLGIWQLRLPGYGTMHYFQYNYFGREIIPAVDPDEAEMYYQRYQEQWSRIDSVTRGSMTQQDEVLLPLMEQDSLYVTRSPEYTVALDRAIASENRRMILDEPMHYLATRLYAAVRLWVTNINLPMEKIVYRPTPGVRPVVGKPVGLMGWAKALVPFLITVSTFGVGIPLLILSVWRDPRRWYDRRYMLYLIGYVWMIHIPMVIQSRYTVPVHGLAIACFAFMISDRRSRGQVEARPAGAWRDLAQSDDFLKSPREKYFSIKQ